jgi:metacaspase-1
LALPQGISIHVGLNGVDPDQYEGWDGKLNACEADANDMEAIAKGHGFETHKLLTTDATAEALIAAFDDAAGKLADGDILLVSYSGHGGQLPDTNGDEDDRMDETWVLYNRQVVDDELYAFWAKCKPGVRIALFSDSCHSGTVARGAVEAVGEDRVASAAGTQEFRLKGMPDEYIQSVYQAHKEEYDEIQRSVPAHDAADVKASVILTSGCQDNQTSLDGDKNGLFTQNLLQVWDDGKFRGGYRTFHKNIAHAMPPWQSPNFFTVGGRNAKFATQHPFTV